MVYSLRWNWGFSAIGGSITDMQRQLTIAQAIDQAHDLGGEETYGFQIDGAVEDGYFGSDNFFGGIIVSSLTGPSNPGNGFYASQMNNFGCAIGDANGGTTQFWDGAEAIDLGGWANALNDQNFLVGFTWNSGTTTAVLWDMTDGTPPVNLQSLVPKIYKTEVENITPWAISNVNSNNTVYVLCNAQVLEGPGSGTWTWETIMFQMDPYDPTDGPFMRILQIPDGISLQSINANGLISALGAPSGTGSQHALLLLPVEVMRVWSDQLPGVEANYLADARYNGQDSIGTGLGDKKYIFLGASQSNNSDGKGHIKAQVVISGTGTNSLRDKILWRLAKYDNSGNLTVASGSSSYATYDANSQVVSVTVDKPDDDDTNTDYILVGGYDANGNGQLEASEANIIPKCLYKGQRLPFEIKLVSASVVRQADCIL